MINLGSFFTAMGSATGTLQDNITNTFSPMGSITMLVGHHTVKIGSTFNWLQFNVFNPSAYPNGYIAFNGDVSNHGSTGNATTYWADFLTGNIKTAQYTLPQPVVGRRSRVLGAYVMDDWKPCQSSLSMRDSATSTRTR